MAPVFDDGRSGLVATLQRRGDRPVVVATCHLPFADAAARQAQASACAAAAERQARRDDASLTVLCGDFNENAAAPACRLSTIVAWTTLTAGESLLRLPPAKGCAARGCTGRAAFDAGGTPPSSQSSSSNPRFSAARFSSGVRSDQNSLSLPSTVGGTHAVAATSAATFGAFRGGRAGKAGAGARSSVPWPISTSVASS